MPAGEAIIEVEHVDAGYPGVTVLRDVSFTNDLVVKSVNGECSIQIPVNGTDSATMASQISNAIIQERKAILGGRFAVILGPVSPGGPAVIG